VVTAPGEFHATIFDRIRRGLKPPIYQAVKA
jgi:hypothetical protein